MGKEGKSIFTAFNMREISAVTNPAQEGAKMTILKRDFSAEDRKRLAESGAAMPDGSFPIETEADLKNAVQAYGRASDPAAAKKHIIARARALNCLSYLPEEWNVKKVDAASLSIAILKRAGDNGAQTFSQLLQVKEEQEKAWKVQAQLYPIFDAINSSVSSILGDKNLTLAQKTSKVNDSVDQFLKAVRAKFPEVEAEIAKMLNDLDDKGASIMSKELEDKVTKLEGDLATAAKALATATALAGMTDDQKAFHAKLAKPEDKTAFEAATPEARTSQVAKAREGDETLEVEGTVIRKSEVGLGVFAVLKSQQTAIAASAIAIKAAEERSVTTIVAKRAESELEGFPGKPEEKVAVIKAIMKDPVADKAFTTMMKAVQKVYKSLFEERGVSDELPDDGVDGNNNAEAEINKLAKEAQKADPKLSYEQSVAKVLADNPELYTEYDRQSTQRVEDPGD